MAWKHKNKVMKSYDATAELYEERYATEQNAKYKKTLQTVDVSGMVILDVGCGLGLFFPVVAPSAAMVVGVDISRKLLKKAKKHSQRFPEVFVVLADADRLPFRDRFFDEVFSFTVLQNMPKPSVAVREMVRVVKTDGKVAVTGLKKAFALEQFMDVLETTGFDVCTFEDSQEINCYIAVLSGKIENTVYSVSPVSDSL